MQTLFKNDGKGRPMINYNECDTNKEDILTPLLKESIKDSREQINNEINEHFRRILELYKNVDYYHRGLESVIEMMASHGMKHTVDFIPFVDLEAFKEAIENVSPRIYFEESKNYFIVQLYRYAYDVNGFNVGFEIFEFKYKIYNKGEFNGRGHIRKVLDKCIIPNAYTVKVKPACRENKNYMKSDNDFADQEYEYILKEIMKNLSNMEFHHDNEKKWWQIGDKEFPLDKENNV